MSKPRVPKRRNPYAAAVTKLRPQKVENKKKKVKRVSKTSLIKELENDG